MSSNISKMYFKCFQDCTPKDLQIFIKVLQIDQRNQNTKISHKKVT